MPDNPIQDQPHLLICGVTQSGKTTLAHALAEHEARQKNPRQMIVYDPVGTETAAGTWPECSPAVDIYTERDEFLKELPKYEGRPCLIFVDEADDVFRHSEPENTAIIRRGRHHGWQIVLITQRPKLLSPSARSQCGRIAMFRMARDDAKAVANDAGHNELEKITLDRGDYLLLNCGDSAYECFHVFHQLKRGSLKWISDTGSKSQRSPSSSSPSRTASRPSRRS